MFPRSFHNSYLLDFARNRQLFFARRQAKIKAMKLLIVSPDSQAAGQKFTQELELSNLSEVEIMREVFRAFASHQIIVVREKSEPVMDDAKKKLERRIGDLCLNLLSREFFRAGKKISLNPNEFSLLNLLMENQEKVFSKKEILEKVWGYHHETKTNIVDVLVYRLRSKVDYGFSSSIIKTVRGCGFQLLLP